MLEQITELPCAADPTQTGQKPDNWVPVRFGHPLAHLLAEVAAQRCIKVSDLRSRNRSRHIRRVRNEFYYRAVTETRYAATRIGAWFGSCHSTVLYGARKHALAKGLPMPDTPCIRAAHHGSYEDSVRRSVAAFARKSARGKLRWEKYRGCR